MTEEGDEVHIDECEEEDNVDFKVRVRGASLREFCFRHACLLSAPVVPGVFTNTQLTD